ncbi:AMP-binding protein [Eubacterium oxidoreducens]|uniref:Acyl-CoA synthetase (AMP-forming)/AMP-acid ligase II n=1 Tax=Eubacterium oxidoreducens TaxID=1732 RepID=A0A1G6B4R3_EUBOX|nr:AMP-binding protein [Eubacterium oxidoreducens]SDB15656.1 Acyl-CoA synthetase (AMP-forming)/AMP-acid ligase II [Eubacterium oxidoreducens]
MNNTAFIDDQNNSITYEELEEMKSQLAAKLKGRRNLVFSFCKNSIGSVVGYLAFLASKNVPLLLKADIDQELRENLIQIYRPQYLYVPVEMKEAYAAYKEVWNRYDYVLLQTANEKEPMAEELALLLTTSGSTGSPKLVRQSYRNIKSNAEAIAQYLKLDETERPITTLPMNYTYGLSIINSHLLCHATILLTDYTLMQREFWDFLKEQKATSFGGVPYTYEMLKRLRFFQMDLPSLRYMTQAGGKLRAELHKEFAEYAIEQGKEFIVMYGQTEATARMAYLPGEKALEKYGSMGIAIPGGKLWLKDVDGQEITKPDVVGELVYEGENVTLGYAQQREDLARGDERGGVLETGDMARMDEEGYFYIVGRKKRFLKIFGNRVNLDETERLLNGEFENLEIACAGSDDKMAIYYVGEADEASIRHYISQKSGLHPSAFKAVQVEEIPKNDAGKILYNKLEQ